MGSAPSKAAQTPSVAEPGKTDTIPEPHTAPTSGGEDILMEEIAFQRKTSLNRGSISSSRKSSLVPAKVGEHDSDSNEDARSRTSPIASSSQGRPSQQSVSPARNSTGGEILRRRLIQSSIKQSGLNGSQCGSINTMSTIGALPNINTLKNSRPRNDAALREETNFEKELSKTLQLRAYTKGESIVRKGDIGLEMMFIKSGSVTVRDETGNVVYATLDKGAFFGEIGVLFPMKRTASVLAETHCIVNVLRKDKLDTLLYKYPSMNSRFRKVANVRLQDIRQMNEKSLREKTEATKKIIAGDTDTCPYPMPNPNPT